MHGFSLGLFLDKQKEGHSYILAPYLTNKNEPPILLENIKPIRKWHYKSKNRIELNNSDFERFHFNKLKANV